MFYAHLTHAHMLRSNSQLPFYPSTRVPILHSFTCKQAPDVALVPGAEVQGASESFAERGDATSLSVLQERTMLGISGGDVVGS